MTKTFRCHCGELWYKCKIHKVCANKEEGNTELSIEQKRSFPDKALTKVVKTARREVQDDLEGHFKTNRKRKLQACEPRFSVNMLSAGLKRKFASLCQTGEG